MTPEEEAAAKLMELQTSELVQEAWKVIRAKSTSTFSTVAATTTLMLLGQKVGNVDPLFSADPEIAELAKRLGIMLAQRFSAGLKEAMDAEQAKKPQN